MKILQLIKDNYNTLTKAEKKIANFVLTSPDRIVYGTMNDIKKAVHVGDATIIRFCHKLGYSGYSDLKIEIAKEDYSESEINNNIFFEESEQKLFQTLQNTKNNLTNDLLEKASLLISNASSIHILGVGLSGNTAQDLEAMFLRIGVQAKTITDTHFQLQTAAILKSTDLIIVISLSGKTKDLLDSIKVAKEHKSNVIAITNFFSPIAQLSDLVLQTTAEEFFNGGSLSGKIAQLYICELLVKYYEKQHEHQSLINRESIIRAVMNKSIE